jgi:hypothetical protein
MTKLSDLPNKFEGETIELSKNLFDLRFKKATRQSFKSHEIAQLKRERVNVRSSLVGTKNFSSSYSFLDNKTLRQFSYYLPIILSSIPLLNDNLFERLIRAYFLETNFLEKYMINRFLENLRKKDN